MINSTKKRVSLRTGAAFGVLALFGAGAVAQPALAQEQTETTPLTTTAPPQPEAGEEIVVTGSILRQTSTSATASPITVVEAEALDQRGINTIQDAIQQLSSNNGPALTNSFTANGAFAAGASAVSLRGLSTNSTLVLFDGQRAAYYPLADDGSRNFVDLNTIPDDVVERIEVLRDGASSTYGADAIAGVVNIITKRQFKGVGGRVEAGISEDGNAANQRLSLTVGTGDLDENGLNAYLSGFYYRSEAVYNRDLPYPYNTDDQTGICFEDNCGPNNINNGRNPETGRLEGFSVPYDLYVRPYNAANTAVVPGSRFELLNPGAGCRFGEGAYRLTAAELAQANNASAPSGLICPIDVTNQYAVASPNIQRFGGTARVTAKLGDTTEGYFMANFQQSTVDYTGFPGLIRSQANAGIFFRPFSTAAGPSAALAPGSFALTLPVYVCANGVADASGLNTGCNATNGVLNPNNPYAAQNQVARVLGRPFTSPTYNETRSRVYRAALGVRGEFAPGWSYNVDATAMHNDLRRTQRGYFYIANLLTSIANGSLNLLNPDQNSQAVRDFVTPDNINDASSDLYAIQATVATDLVELPGGPLQLGFGGQIRYEAVDAPSGNSDVNGPTQRFFTLNAFGTTGDRTVYSAFGELRAPVLEQVEINASGRYDNYSSGQDNFSPKVGVLLTPIRQIALRANYSRGFRIPAFGEANALPTTGFVSVATSTLPASFLSQYGANCRPDNAAGCPTYITAYSRGSTTLASPDLEPEKSRSITAGVVLAPIPQFRFTVDYFNIKKTGAITTPQITPALAAYFAGQPIPAGFNVIADAPSTEFPNALPRPAFVESNLVNANTILSEGIDFAANLALEFGDIRWTTSAEASLILELSTTFPDGTKQEYQGTLGNYQLTAGSGTPKWHGNLQSTVEVDTFSLTGNLNWFGGYDLSAEDESGPGTAGDCGLSPGYVPCRVDDYLTVDLTGSVKVNDNFTFYVNVLNAFNSLPPIDPVTYGAHLYNPVQGGTGVFGRAFRAGVRFGL